MGPEDADPDQRLLAGLVRGEPGAEVAFVRRFQSRVYGLATAIVGDGPRGEEVAKEALVRACHHARTYESSRGPVISWVLGITRRLAVETRRRDAAEPGDGTAATWLTGSETRLGQLDPGPAAEPGASVGERTAAVRRALLRLPDEQRRAVVLAVLHGYTAPEISEAEAVPLDMAKARIRSGLTMMQALFRQDAP